MDTSMEDATNTTTTASGAAAAAVAPPPAAAAAAAAAADPLQPPGSRLIIQKMELENFKSYFGKKTIGPFHKCFSSVVGPNGSGKSNVIDALLFVFGFNAKKIRQSKAKELIHNSENHQNVPMCSVSVHFVQVIDKEGDDYEIIAGSELVVKRVVKRDSAGTTMYLNGHRKKKDEITTILKGRGVDLDHNRFLILQGEVEQIAMMKPKGATEHEDGLLEFLEDIIGSNRFKEPIAEKEKEVEQLSEVRSERLNRVKAVEKEKDSLEGSKKEAEAYLEKENECTTQKSKLYQVYKRTCDQKVDEAKEVLAARQEEADAIKADLKDKQQHAKEMEKVYKKETKEHDALTKAQAHAKSQFAAFERQDIQHQEKLKSAKKRTKTLESSLKKDRAKTVEHETKVSRARDDIESLAEEVATQQTKLTAEDEKLEKLAESFKGETDKVQAKLEAKQTEMAPFSQTLNEAKQQRDITQSELELITANQRNLEKQRADTKDNLDKAISTSKERKQQIRELTKMRGKAQAELTTAQAELETCVGTEADVAIMVSHARTKVQESKESSSSVAQQSALLKGLMSQGIDGVYGRLGNLAGIDLKFDCAITTACGALNNIVVQTVEAAQTALKYIKANQLGIATFIILDKLSYRPTARKELPSGAIRLFDQLDFGGDKERQEKFEPAFYYALRDTLVADSTASATKLAFGSTKRWRVVTFDGVVIDTSGTMAGGGTKKMRGGMSATPGTTEAVSAKEIARMEKRLAVDEKQLATCRQRKQALERTIADLTKKLSSIDMDLKRFAMDVEAAEKQRVQLEAQQKELANATVSDDDTKSKQQELEKQLSREEAAVAKAQAGVDKIEAQLATLQKALADVGGIAMKNQRGKVQGLNDQIEALQDRSTKAKADIKTGERNLTKLGKKVAKDEKELEATHALIEKLQGEFKSIEERAGQVMEEYQTATDTLQDREDHMKALKKDHDAIKEEVTGLRSKELDVEHKLEEVRRKAHDVERQAKGWKKKLGSLKLHKIARSALDSEDEEMDVDDDEAAPQAEAEAGMDVDGADEAGEGQDATAEPSKRQRGGKRGLPVLEDVVLDEVDTEALEYDISVLDEQLKAMQPNMAAIREYYRKEEEYLIKVADLDAITEKRDEARSQYEALRKERLDTFMAGFSVITLKLKEMYQMITLGGDAELELVDRLNPFSEGIVFSVRPPKKSWKNISNLSGGEKTLSSLALVFALHHYKPTPLYVMDEIDAALDFKNVSIVANYIKERTKNAQFIIISLRNNMFELADRLIGIYKTDNCTKTVTVNPKAIADKVAQAGVGERELMKAKQPLLDTTAALQPMVST